MSTTESTIATGNSARMLIEGMTISKFSGPYSFEMPRTSASKVISTSPVLASTKVVVEARPPVSNTGTLSNSLPMNSCAFSWSPPFSASA